MPVQATTGTRHGPDFDDEYLFLRERELALVAELEERAVVLDGEFPEGVERPRGLTEWDRLWQRELALVRDLQARVARVPLDALLRRRLRYVQGCLQRLGAQARDRGTYSPAYWQEEEERQILNSLLRRWWRWHYGPIQDPPE